MSSEHGESAHALAQIIERAAVCSPCRAGRCRGCIKSARDVIAQKSIPCQCETCCTPADRIGPTP